MIICAIPLAVIVGAALGWLYILWRDRRPRTSGPIIRNYARHGVDPNGWQTESQLIEQWQKCKVPGCWDCGTIKEYTRIEVEYGLNRADEEEEDEG